MDEQLTIYGESVPFPIPKPKRMNGRQRDLWLWIACAPAGCIRTTDARRFYVDASGALRRLEALGTVERVGRGRWKAK